MDPIGETYRWLAGPNGSRYPKRRSYPEKEALMYLSSSRPSRRACGAAFSALFALMLSPAAVEAQSFGDRLLKKARQSVDQRIDRAAEKTVEQGLDATEEAIRCAITDTDCIRAAEQQGREVVYTDSPGASVVPAANAPAQDSSRRVGADVWANYDFVPGERVLFADDFSGDRVGNFPRRLEFVSGLMEVVQLDGSRYLRATSDSQFELVLPEALPERFTIEFEAHLPHWWHLLFLAMSEPDGDGGYATTRVSGQSLDRYPFSYVQLSKQFESGLAGEGGGTALTRYEPLHEGIVPVRIMADGRYMKVFLDERRIANVPNANLRRSNRLAIFITGEVSEARPVFLGNFRIAAGGPSLYDALQADGRATTQGILFDVGSDRIRPESTPTLKEIAEMLGAHGDLRLMIEGHTDSTGDPETNAQLSNRRAAAVKQELVTTFGISPARLETTGKGQSEPVSSNDTPEGRQNNRRVVLVRI
jgi:OmpA-OmpF porin, OOP family